SRSPPRRSRWPASFFSDRHRFGDFERRPVGLLLRGRRGGDREAGAGDRRSVRVAALLGAARQEVLGGELLQCRVLAVGRLVMPLGLADGQQPLPDRRGVDLLLWRAARDVRQLALIDEQAGAKNDDDAKKAKNAHIASVPVIGSTPISEQSAMRPSLLGDSQCFVDLERRPVRHVVVDRYGGDVKSGGARRGDEVIAVAHRAALKLIVVREILERSVGAVLRVKLPLRLRERDQVLL